MSEMFVEGDLVRVRLDPRVWKIVAIFPKWNVAILEPTGESRVFSREVTIDSLVRANSMEH